MDFSPNQRQAWCLISSLKRATPSAFSLLFTHLVALPRGVPILFVILDFLTKWPHRGSDLCRISTVLWIHALFESKCSFFSSNWGQTGLRKIKFTTTIAVFCSPSGFILLTCFRNYKIQTSTAYLFMSLLTCTFKLVTGIQKSLFIMRIFMKFLLLFEKQSSAFFVRKQEKSTYKLIVKKIRIRLCSTWCASTGVELPQYRIIIYRLSQFFVFYRCSSKDVGSYS